MKLHRIISYSLMTAGAVASAKAVLKRWQWEEVNVHVAIMLDWDDVQAVATRAVEIPMEADEGWRRVESLLRRFRECGATHLSIPELTLNRLLEKGQLSVEQGPSVDRVHLRAHNLALAERVTGELRARLPHIQARRTKARNPLISFKGDLPGVAEVGLGFDPDQANLARRAGLSPVARPIGYSWVQPEMIDRTLDQAAALGAKVVAVQGHLIPGHEFNLQTTVEAMQRNRLTYAYFSHSRHQKGDWFLAKNLASDGLVILAHELEPAELLEEDLHTACYRWTQLAVEGGVRLCSVRFFRVLHAADPLESLAYVQELSNALTGAGLIAGHAGAVDLTVYQPRRDNFSLACAGLSAAGAAGLAADLLPLPDRVKLVGLGATALSLAGLPFLEKIGAGDDHHHHDHNLLHPESKIPHHHHHDHSHNHDRTSATAYAPKGLALAASVAFPAAAVAINGAGALISLGHALATAAAGAITLSATTAETDYVMGIETYRGYNLDWLLPPGLAALTGPTISDPCPEPGRRIKSQNWSRLAVAGAVVAALKSIGGPSSSDPLAALDREHRHAHTHHLSAFQRAVGDIKMTLSPRPLRKWSLLAPLGAVGAVLLKQRGPDKWAPVARTTAAAGQVATLAGFRNGQRPLLKTLGGRARGWAIGGILAAGLVWLGNRSRGH